jgi:hypothetical protein
MGCSSGPLPLHDAVDPRQVGGDADRAVAERLEFGRELPRGASRSLENDPPLWPQARARGRSDLRRDSRADERGAGLPLAHLRLERLDLVGADVGRIRDDQVEPANVEALGQIVAEEADPRSQLGRSRVRERDLERRGRVVDRRHFGAGVLVRDPQRNRS